MFVVWTFHMPNVQRNIYHLPWPPWNFEPNTRFRGGLSICASARGLAELMASEEIFRSRWSWVCISRSQLPLFLKVKPPKEGLFQWKQESFGLQVYIIWYNSGQIIATSHNLTSKGSFLEGTHYFREISVGEIFGQISVFRGYVYIHSCWSIYLDNLIWFLYLESVYTMM